MPVLKIIIDGRLVDLLESDTSPAVISYNLEDESDFQSKSSAMSFDVTCPATLNNDATFNTFRDPAIIDTTPDNNFRKARNGSIFVDEIPVLVGKALLKSGSNTDKPGSYVANFYGDNGDWIVDMQDLTLFDCLPTNPHTFDVGPIQASWLNDGTDPAVSWVYAPVRYGQAFSTNDTNVAITEIRPSLFVYWIIQRAFAKYGYRISSAFMDSPVFRRLTMPWTWGDFLGINSKLADLLKFRATGPVNGGSNHFYTSSTPYGNSGGGSGIIRPGVLSTGAHNPPGDNFCLENTNSPYGYDNFGVFSFDWINGLWIWTYKETGGHFGTITAFFGVSCSGYVDGSWNSHATIYMDVFLNGNIVQQYTVFNAQGGATSQATDQDDHRVVNFSVANLVVNDQVKIRFRYDYFKSYLGQHNINLEAMNQYGSFANNPDPQRTTFELFRITIQPGGTVDWKNFEQFKNYKFLDFLRGVLDVADIIPKTDPANKVVVMEPAYGGKVGTTTFGGYFKNTRKDWSAKLDVSQEATVVSYDDLERDYIFTMKADSSDGGLQVFTKRYGEDITSAKFRFNSRFKDGSQTFENRFFSPVMHVKFSQWSALSNYYGFGKTPQLIAIVPENISNTSASESDYNFAPKLAYYKGYLFSNNSDGVGCWMFNGSVYTSLPYMFAVNYLDTTGNDIALTYNDQRINNAVVPGLMRRFYLPRLAIMDNGVQYKPWILLNNNDVTDWMHRDKIVINGTLYALTNIDKWDPVKPLSSQCTMWKFVQVEAKHAAQVFPSSASVLGTLSTINTPDLAYQPNIILYSDLPTYGS